MIKDTVEYCRNQALDRLKPTTAELEHGLELHREALVIDSYGFCPRAPADQASLDDAEARGATLPLRRQMDQDQRLTGMVRDQQARADFVEAFEAAGVDCVLQNSGEEGNAVERLLPRLGMFTYLTDAMPEVLHRCYSPQDIVEAKQAGKRCLYLSTNGVPLAQRWDSPWEELRFIRTFFQLGTRMMHLTYNRRNPIGDGCVEPANAGLSEFGVAAVGQMDEVGIIVDGAHAGQQTCQDAARVSERPVVISHASVHGLHPHSRAKTDRTIRAVAETGGYIGICAIPAFLGGRGDITAMLDHIDYVAKTFGHEHVAIGTDRAAEHRPPEAPTPERRPVSQKWEPLWAQDEPLFDAHWHDPGMQASLAWTNWPLFTVGLVQRGYSDEAIRQIIGGNVLRVARAVFDGRKT